MREKVIKLIENILNLDEGTLKEDSKIEDVAGWDSLAHVLIVGEMEETLGIVIPLEEALEITSLEELFEKAGI